MGYNQHALPNAVVPSIAVGSLCFRFLPYNAMLNTTETSTQFGMLSKSRDTVTMAENTVPVIKYRAIKCRVQLNQ